MSLVVPHVASVRRVNHTLAACSTRQMADVLHKCEFRFDEQSSAQPGVRLRQTLGIRFNTLTLPNHLSAGREPASGAFSR